jgi:hypothetical protein
MLLSAIIFLAIYFTTEFVCRENHINGYYWHYRFRPAGVQVFGYSGGFIDKSYSIGLETDQYRNIFGASYYPETGKLFVEVKGEYVYVRNPK